MVRVRRISLLTEQHSAAFDFVCDGRKLESFELDAAVLNIDSCLSGYADGGKCKEFAHNNEVLPDDLLCDCIAMLASCVKKEGK